MQGGVGAYTRIIAQKFTELNQDVFVYTDKQALESDGRINLTTTSGWGPLSLHNIRQWVHDNRLDVVILQFETAAFDMSPWVHFLPDMVRSVPFVTRFHDLLVPYLFPKAGIIRDWIVQRLARASDGVIATNHEDFSRLKSLPFSELIPIGSNIANVLIQDYDPGHWRNAAEVDENEFLVAHFGFINRSKGIEILLEDVALLRNRYGYPIRLLMIGGRTGDSDPENAAYAREIDTLIERIGLGDSIYWTGFVDEREVSCYLRAVDAVILPFRDGASYRRGSLMAAIGHGCAIITTAPQYDVPDFVDGENMLLVYPEIIDSDVPPYVHVTPQILRLYRNPELRQRLRAGALELAKRFEWDNIADQYLTFLNRMLEARS